MLRTAILNHDCGHGCAFVVLRSLTLWEIVNECGLCRRNCGGREPKNLDIAATIAVVDFLKSWFCYGKNNIFACVFTIR